LSCQKQYRIQWNSYILNRKVIVDIEQRMRSWIWLVVADNLIKLVKRRLLELKNNLIYLVKAQISAQGGFPLLFYFHFEICTNKQWEISEMGFRQTQVFFFWKEWKNLFDWILKGDHHLSSEFDLDDGFTYVNSSRSLRTEEEHKNILGSQNGVRIACMVYGSSISWNLVPEEFKTCDTIALHAFSRCGRWNWKIVVDDTLINDPIVEYISNIIIRGSLARFRRTNLIARWPR
jgi:hypothetical protein